MFWIAYSFIFDTNNFKGLGFRLEKSKLLVGAYLISLGTLFQIFGPEHRIDCVHLLRVENGACKYDRGTTSSRCCSSTRLGLKHFYKWGGDRFQNVFLH